MARATPSGCENVSRVATHDEETLRRFLAARRAGDPAAARRAWEDLLAANFDRVRAMVALECRGRLSEDERQEALQGALMRMAGNMIHTFRGTSMGQWVESTRTLVRYQCMDVQRRAAAISRRERALENDTGQPDAEVYASIEAARREQERRDEEAGALRDRQAFLDWAVPQLPARRRAVIDLDRADVPVEEIQERLGMSRDAVYASRSRALKDLVKLRDRYDP